jgi:hypothetical protein
MIILYTSVRILIMGLTVRCGFTAWRYRRRVSKVANGVVTDEALISSEEAGRQAGVRFDPVRYAHALGAAQRLAKVYTHLEKLGDRQCRWQRRHQKLQ